MVATAVLAGASLISAALASPAAAGTGAAEGRGRFTVSAEQPLPDGSTLAAQVKAARSAARKDGRTAIVVKLKDAPLASYRGTVSGLRATAPSVTGAARLDLTSPASRGYLSYLHGRMDSFESRARSASPKATFTHRFDTVLGGVSVVLPAADLAKVARDPDVAAIYVDTVQKVQTSVTPQFLGAPAAWNALGGQESAGEGVIVGVIDTGIWPEHPSLSDPDPSGKAYAAPKPTRDGSARPCDFSSGSNPGPAFTCNNKLIGAETFLDTYDALVGPTAGEYTSARDDEGHGTHTATTAAGNAGVAASVFGIPRGVVSGIAPRAQIIAYRALGLQGGFSSDLAAAVERAIVDNVDVINYSVSGGANPYGDVVSLAFLDAYNAGVFVAASAGNSGPTADTTDHREPWVTTVAASTGPRSFVGSATLTAADGASLKVSGTTIAPALTTPSPVVNAADAPYSDPLCQDATADGAFAGKVVLCERGVNGRAEKGFNVLQRGAVGMILYNQSPAVTDQETDNHYLPAVHVQVGDGTKVIAFLGAHANVSATITTGVASPAQADVMASFSSRGGSGQSLGISKPDVTAPGVQILAGNTPTPIDVASGPKGQLFQAIAGTSMSAPHVTGAGALLKALHPTWTPGQIHSALMTTAVTKTVKEDGVTPTDAFDDGSGRIDIAAARDPLFTIDETGAAFVAQQASLDQVNYPSLYVPDLAGKVTVTRTLRSVSSSAHSFHVSVSAPRDLAVTVSPPNFNLAKNATRAIAITVDGRDVPLGQTRFATITLKSQSRTFTFPVTVVRGQGPVAVTKTCAPDPVAKGSSTGCTITMTNNASSAATVTLKDVVPSRLKVTKGSVVGGTSSGNTVRSTVTLPGRKLPTVSEAIAPGSTPAGGYLPLSSFGIAPITGVGDETISNFTVAPFTLAGVSYDRIGIVSDGYVVLGGGTQADVDFVNQRLPDASRPNNVIAPFWSDLNATTAGAVRIGSLSDGVTTWTVVDFDGVPEYSTPGNTHSFEIWLANSTTEDVTVAYGPSTGTGDGGLATVGVENPDGSQGQSLYVNGTGTLPVDGDEVRVTGTPGVTSSATVTFAATARSAGSYVNYAEVTGDGITGTAIARFAGTVTK